MAVSKWSEWLALKESNARKRAVKSALQGTGPKLPGSYAACPSTNSKAMDSAEKSGVVEKSVKTENKKPDYSIDRWIDMAKDLGDDINKSVHHGKSKEAEIEKQKKDIDAKAKEPDKEDGDEQKKTNSLWQKFKKDHKKDPDKRDAAKQDQDSEDDKDLDKKS